MHKKTQKLVFWALGSTGRNEAVSLKHLQVVIYSQALLFM